MSDLRKWYFSINERGFNGCFDQIKVAVRSCADKTKLIPHCIYGGENLDHIRQLEGLGVKVISHRISIESELAAAYGSKYEYFSGHWLRVDLPTIESDDDLVLYTDTDVIFLADVKEIAAPPLLSAAPEFKIDDYSKFNSGVMVLNIRNLKNVQADFLESIRERLGNNFQYPAHDQESYNRFFLDKYTRLAPEFNWKVYWGINPDATILHLHGPKFHIANRLKAGDDKGIPAGHIRLWKKNPQAFDFYERVFNRYL